MVPFQKVLFIFTMSLKYSITPAVVDVQWTRIKNIKERKIHTKNSPRIIPIILLGHVSYKKIIFNKETENKNKPQNDK